MRPGQDRSSVILRLGVRPHLARLLAATPALRLSSLSAVTVSLALSVAAAHGGHGQRGLLLFLLVAPLLPVAGVAAAFSPQVDPASELTLASPSGGFQLLLIRAVAVLATTTVLAGLAAVALPGHNAVAVAWLLPAFGLSVLSLAVASFVEPITAAGWVGSAWVVGVLLGERAGAGSLRALFMPGPLESGAFHAQGQVVFAAMTVVAAAVVGLRRHSFDVGRLA